MMGYYSNFMDGFGFFSWIFMIVFWGIIIWGIVAFIRWVSTQNTTNGKKDRAQEILKERYAKGEIPREEFEEKKKDLSN